MAERQYWITGINPKKYNIKKAFASRDEIDWCLNVGPKEKVEVGDIVYIYTYTYPRGCKEDEYVNFKTVVVETDIEPKDRLDDKEFVTEMGMEDITDGKKFTRLKLLQTFPDFLPVSCLVARSLRLKKTMTQSLQSDCTDFMSIHDHAEYFPKGCFSYLIDKCSKEWFASSDSSQWKAVAENVRLILPQLISWIRSCERFTSMSYFELIRVLKKVKKVVPAEITMEVIHNVLTALSKETRQEIPTLNAVVTDLFTGLPNHKFDYVFKGFDDLSKEDKLKVLEGYNAKAYKYDNWEWVLSMLGLGHNVDKDLIKRTHLRIGRPSTKSVKDEIKELKIRVLEKARDNLIHTYADGVIDYVLLSGERVDVYFPDIKTAVEIVPSTASEEDILRGLFKCVRDKALLEAEAKYNGDFNKVDAILGASEYLPEKMYKIAEFLKVRVVDRLSWNEEQWVEYLRELDGY